MLSFPFLLVQFFVGLDLLRETQFPGAAAAAVSTLPPAYPAAVITAPLAETTVGTGVFRLNHAEKTPGPARQFYLGAGIPGPAWAVIPSI